MRPLQNAYWILFTSYDGVPNDELPQMSSSTVFVYHPHSRYLFCTPILKKNEQYLMKALGAAFDCSLQSARLSGRDLDGLKELLLNQHSQGRYRVLRHTHAHSDPLDRRRAAPKSNLDADIEFMLASDANVASQRSNEAALVFGEHKQPVLNSISFDVKARSLAHSLRVDTHLLQDRGSLSRHVQLSWWRADERQIRRQQRA